MGEIEEELAKSFNSGGAPFVALRVGNVIGPKENTIRYWLLHLWVRAHLPLTMPMHLDDTMLENRISLSYTPDIAQAVQRVIARSLGEICCAEKVQEVFHNHSIVLYPDVYSGAVSAEKAMDVLRWSPTDLAKAIRSVALFYDRVMIENTKYKKEKSMMFDKVKRMLGKKDGPRLTQWINDYYDERRKTDLYDEFDDEEEDDIALVRPDAEKRKTGKQRRKGGKSSEL